MDIRRYFLTFGKTGLLKNGSAAAIAIAAVIGILVLGFMGGESLFMLALASSVIAIFEIDKYYSEGVHLYDHGIVIDKVAGVWLAETVATQTPSGVPGLYGLVFASLISAILFYMFVKYRPSTIGWIHNRIKGGLGIILDDTVSGFAAGVLSVLLLKAVTVYNFI